MADTRIRRSRTLTAAAVATAALAAGAPPVLGADDTATTSAAVFTDPVQLLNAFALLFLFGAFVVLAVVVYLIVTDRAFYQAVGAARGRGQPVTVSEVSATAGPAAQSLGQGGTPPDLTVSGPASVTVGTPVGYAAKLGDAAADAATWTAEPADAAAIGPSTGGAVRVVAIKAGPIKLTAANGLQRATLSITAEAPPSRGIALPFVGGGWGTIVVSTVIVVVAAALGVGGVLGGQAIAGLYGALVGYLFGMRPGSGGSGSGGTGGSGSGGNAGGTGGARGAGTGAQAP